MNIHRLIFLLVYVSFCLFLSSCEKDGNPAIFQLITSEKSGINFENTITTTDSSNSENEPFIYNGAGVAIGDINNDGLMDLYFTGNMVSSRLYLNKGNMEFEDITESAGVGTSRWATGATMVDINHDGFLDIYVSVSNSKEVDEEQRRNLLFINNGDQTFTEQAADFGIDDTGFTTQSVFLDYDKDGDLDLFLLNNSPEEFSRGETGVMPTGVQLDEINPGGLDQLYQNNGDGTFTNVSREAGILRKLGYGLGVSVSDINQDGWPDIYVSNDISPNDVLYINNGDGTFTDRAAEWLRHTSYAGMGIDIADFTNNGWPDILQSDMMPEDIHVRKLMSGSNSYSGFIDLQKRGFYPHYNINTLQMNHGVNSEGNVIFSEIARLAGVAYTHWSWTSLFADLDNDGFKDILITNGYPKALNDFDYLSDMHLAGQTDSREEYDRRRREILENLHDYEIPNYVYRNNGDLTFTDKTDEWGLGQPGFSYGAATADLDNDGRLDLVVNNINTPAWVYHNVGDDDESSRYLMAALHGQAPNTGGIGAKVWLWAGGQMQFKYQNPYRGFMSSVDPRLHFGLGAATTVDSLKIQWPDGQTQLLHNIPADQLITLDQRKATPPGDESILAAWNQRSTLFEEVSGAQSLSHRDTPSSFVDYGVQPLLPYMVSRQGPPVAVADVNGDGLEDVYIGGAAGAPGTLFIQQANGTFAETSQPQPWRADAEQEDWGAVFFDANGDGRPDLYVASGGYHTSPVSLLLADRLYINYGNGRFLKDTNALPQMLGSTAAVAAGDFNGDGRTDLFVGGRLSPRNWPHPARSWLLRNDGDRFTDVTAQMAPHFADPGSMITDALWADINGDGAEELVTAGQWEPIRVYRNHNGQLEEITEQLNLPPLRGWWEALAAGDFNGDGHTDIAAGNLGLNHTYTASPASPFGVVAVDMTGSRTTDIILTKQINGAEYPFYGLAKLGREIYTLGITFDSFESFSNATVQQVVAPDKLEQALRYQADTFASVVLLSDGEGSFTVEQLPDLAQISPIQDIIAADVDGDGHTDLIIGGNLYESEPTAPRADAGNGLWLRGDGQGGFTPVGPVQSGLLAPGDVRHMELVQSPNGPQLIITNNADSTQIFNVRKNY